MKAAQAAVTSKVTKLQVENEALRALSIKLGRLVLNSTGGPASGSGGNNVLRCDTLTPDQIVSALRDLAVECDRLVRISNAHKSAADFEAIGIQFADMAAQLEAAFRIPAVRR